MLGTGLLPPPKVSGGKVKSKMPFVLPPILALVAVPPGNEWVSICQAFLSGFPFVAFKED